MGNNKDVICPNCEEVMGFRNIIEFDDESTEFIGIVYVIRCLKCDCVFVPDVRFSKKATKQQLKEIKKMLEDKL